MQPRPAPRPFRGLRPQDFHDLMRWRVMNILLVCPPYDLYLLEEAGQINERLLGEFRNLDLHYPPGLTGAATGAQALELLAQRKFDLVVTTIRVGDMSAVALGRQIRERHPALPVVLLASDNRELKDFVTRQDVSVFERLFLWQGDARLMLAIVKVVEDRRNVAHDTGTAGVQVILLVEDNVRYYSSFLPAIYAELFDQAQRVVSEGVNLSTKITRMRARPKILLSTSFEEAWADFEAYRDDVLGVISDVEFPRAGARSDDAGLELARLVREQVADVPILLQSSRAENEARAFGVGAAFVQKGSPVLLQALSDFMLEDFGFGDFVFKLPDGREVARASDLKALEERLREVPADSVGYHAQRNHFSRWLKARTDFDLAQDLRPRRVSEFASIEELRELLIRSIADYRFDRAQAVVADFERTTFDETVDFCRIGGGSLGGKARGLAFVRKLLGERRVRSHYPGVRVFVPPAAVVATDCFDRFLDDNELRDFAIECDDDAELVRRFDAAEFPEAICRDLADLLERMRQPLAVRSSSILEDSQYQPFTGVYETFMLPNDHPFLEVRLEQLLRAAKRVYASLFTSHAKAYLAATPYRLEEEKMAVIVQQIVGSRHGQRFYPDFAGVARSHNFYPTPPLAAGDGIAAVALGLGRMVVEGEPCLRFSPRYPQHILQFSSVADTLKTSQRHFWALELGDTSADAKELSMREARFDLADAEADGTLARLGSTYSRENDAIYDGISRPGPRLVTFAPLLKQHLFPLAELLEELMQLGQEGMSAPVEIEFAVNLSSPPGAPQEFGFLQMRPLALAGELEELEIGEPEPERVLCRSACVLGNGRVETLRDLVVVDFESFERAHSRAAAQQVGRLNARLLHDGRSYLLVGVGRWGSKDPWLGIPVTWDQIAGARVIVETGFRDFKVAPSQGTHFFQNLTSFHVGYFTVNPEAGEGFVDWDWLAGQPALDSASGVRHLRFEAPLVVLMNGQRNEGVILKP